MQISPKIENSKPNYPKADEIKKISKVLYNHKPNRWKKNVAIVATMALIAISCNKEIDKDRKNYGVMAGVVMMAHPAFTNEDDTLQLYDGDVKSILLDESNIVILNKDMFYKILSEPESGRISKLEFVFFLE